MAPKLSTAKKKIHLIGDSKEFYLHNWSIGHLKRKTLDMSQKYVKKLSKILALST